MAIIDRVLLLVGCCDSPSGCSNMCGGRVNREINFTIVSLLFLGHPPEVTRSAIGGRRTACLSKDQIDTGVRGRQ